MKKKIFWKIFSQFNVYLFLIGLLGGILVTVQWKVRLPRALNPLTPFATLRNARETFTTENKDLSDRIKTLQAEIKTEEEKAKRVEIRSRPKLEVLEQLKEKSGLTEVKGEGIEITLDDSPRADPTAASIAHAADLRDLINVLWGAGAKAVTVNDERIVATTSIDSVINTVMINNTKLAIPFTIRAIGDKDRMVKTLSRDGEIKNIYRRVDTEGLIFTLNPSRHLEVPAFSSSFNFEYTTPQ